MAGRLYAVLIGNGSFPGDLPEGTPRLPTLRCPSEDVRGLKELLSAERHGGYDVTDITDRPHNVARGAVHAALKKAKPEDHVLIYYSGHGKLNEDGDLFLAGSDTDPVSLEVTAFPASELRKWAIASSAETRIVILDCCYSGAAFAETTEKGEIAELAGHVVRALNGRGLFCLTASTDTQLAEEKDNDRYSLLTKYIIKGISEGSADAGDDGVVSFQELCSYVQSQIPLEGNQRPLFFTQRASGDPFVASTGKPAFAGRRREVLTRVMKFGARNLLSEMVISRLLHLLNDPASEQTAIKTLYSIHADQALFIEKVIELANQTPGLPPPSDIERREKPASPKIAPVKTQEISPASNFAGEGPERSELPIKPLGVGAWDKLKRLPEISTDLPVAPHISAKGVSAIGSRYFVIACLAFVALVGVAISLKLTIDRATDNANVLLGPPAAPASAPTNPQTPKAPPPVADAWVYFDIDKYNIRPDAAAVLDKVIAAYKDGEYSRVKIVGHTD